MNSVVSVLLLIIFVNSGYSQSNIYEKEQELKRDFEKLIAAENDSVKRGVCIHIQKNLLNVLQHDESFSYPFSELNSMGKLTSPDQAFRVYNWNCVLSDGTYLYFGIIQYKINKEVRLVVLNDSEFETDMTKQFGKDNWPGALYYKVIPFKGEDRKAYLLLAWDGNNYQTSKKIIEVLTINEKGELQFGSPVINWKGKLLSRVVFEYAKQVRMTIQNDEKRKRLVFDHLAPSSQKYTNQFEYYGPDSSYDALEYRKGEWVLVENVDVRNKKKK